VLRDGTKSCVGFRHPPILAEDCAKCGRTSDHINKEDALVELEQYECELATAPQKQD